MRYREYRAVRVVIEWQVWLALVLGLLSSAFIADAQAKKMLANLGSIEVTVAVTILALVLAGVAIMTTLMNDWYVVFLVRNPHADFRNDIFRFLLVAVVSTVASIIGGAQMLLDEASPSYAGSRAILGLGVFFTAWSILSTLRLVRTVTEWTQFYALLKHDSIESKAKAENDPFLLEWIDILKRAKAQVEGQPESTWKRPNKRSA